MFQFQTKCINNLWDFEKEYSIFVINLCIQFINKLFINFTFSDTLENSNLKN